MLKYNDSIDGMKLEKIIAELCPTGVKYTTLGNVVSFTDGYSFSSGDFVENGDFQVVKITDIFDGKVNVGKTYISELPEKLKEGQRLTGGEIIVAMSGSTGKTGYNTLKNAVVNQRIAILRNSEFIDNGFLKHLLVNRTFEEYCFKNGTGPQNNIGKSLILKYRIPLPPLAVQQEIVRILDSFTELTAELTAELRTRRKQYEYYRDQLLTFGDEVPRIPLSEVGPVCMCKRILKSQTNAIGGVPFYKIGTFGKEANAYISQETYEEYRNKYSFPKKGDILISAAGTIGRTIVYNGEPAYFQDSNIVWIANDEMKILNKFLVYCYAIKPWNISTGGTIARLYNENIQKAMIPAPTLEQQEKIVDTLEKFDSLCNDLTAGLPAEIKARQKQYEYYRDKLLNFKELKGD